MKIGLYNISEISIGKHNVKDSRLDQVDALVKAKKKTYLQVETVKQESCLQADVILAYKESRADLVLADLEFVETRLGRSESVQEKAVLEKLKSALEKEQFINSLTFSDEERALMVSYGTLTNRPVVLIEKEMITDLAAVFRATIEQANYISFFTAGEKETRAWLIKKGATAWESAGVIHSDIQQGFIRAEIISFDDYIAAGGESRAKQAGKQKIEQKEYQMQDCDLANFRFNK